MDPLTGTTHPSIGTPQHQYQQELQTAAQQAPPQRGAGSATPLAANSLCPGVRTNNEAFTAVDADDHDATYNPDSGLGGSADSDSRLSPISSPRAASPYPPSQPIAVPMPASSTSSRNGSSTALTATQQAETHGSGPATPPANGGQQPDGKVPLSPPDPDLNPELLEQLLQKASPAIKDNRFSMAEFLKGKAAMTTAARRELVGGADHTLHKPTAEGADDIASSLEDAGHAADLARQAVHLDSLTRAVAEECKVNRELAGLLLERMEASRRAVECLMRLLICLMEAEAAYSTAMSAAAKTASAGPLTAPSDSSNLSSALEGMVALPAAAAAGHRQLYLELQVLSDAAKGLWRRYSAKAKELKQSVHTVQRGIDGCCKQLNSTLNEHRAACQTFDAAVVWQVPSSSNGAHARGGQQQSHRRTSSAESAGSGSRSSWGGGGVAAAVGGTAVLRPHFRSAPTQDPWMTEGKLVAEQQALKRWQDQERQLLQQGYETLQVLEAERLDDLLKAGQTLAASYPAAVESLPPAATELRTRLGGVGGAGEVGLLSLAQVAAEMRATSEALALRQCESLGVLAQELFCSPDIIRQGPMELWNGRNSSWGSCHFVLTRAGFLHWFTDIDSTTPLEPPLNLSRCEFEAGQAPAFNLVESGTGSWLMARGGRKVTLKAGSIEECCEWAIALRESIALSSSAGGAHGSMANRYS